jgi:hypothetical protein
MAAARITVRQIPLPDDARALTRLARIDYSDAFLLEAGIERSAEEWARAMLEDTPRPVQQGLLVGWTALGLRPRFARSADRVLGWPIARRDPDVLILAAASPLGLRAELLFRRAPGGLLFATLLEQRNAASRALWRAITAPHQQIIRSLLHHATTPPR